MSWASKGEIGYTLNLICTQLVTNCNGLKGVVKISLTTEYAKII
jgi:hypothetical protein